MSTFLDGIIALAQKNCKTIVLPEGEDARTLAAARIIAEQKIANPVVLGTSDLSPIEGVTIIDPATDERKERYAEKLAELRAKKGMTLDEARQLVCDATYFGTMMVKMGDADGLVSGACHSTADTLRPALQILKTAPGTKLVSSFMVMCVPDCDRGSQGTFMFADIGLNEYPDADALSEIAIGTAASWEMFMGTPAQVALLSYSSHGSASSTWVEKIAEATRLVHEKAPQLVCDGELQLDTAIIPSVAALKAPDSPIAGAANVLIFPNLDAGNIGYKLVQRLARAEAYGPILQGIARPVNDLSRGCSADDIVGVVAITAVQAQSISV